MRLQILLIFSLLMVMNAPVNAERSKVVTSEVPVTGFHLGKNLTGFVKIQSCKTCKVTKYKITPDIKAYLDRKKVPLSRFVLSKNKPDSVVTERASGKFVAMKWFTKR